MSENITAPRVIPPAFAGWNVQPEQQMAQQQAAAAPAADASAAAAESASAADATAAQSSSASTSAAAPAASAAEQAAAAQAESDAIAQLKAEHETKLAEAITKAQEEARNASYKDIGKALGFVKDDEAPTVEGLTEALQERDGKLTDAQAQNQAMRIELAILRHAGTHGGDPEALTDSSSFRKQLKALDPATATYDADVAELVKTSIEKNPRYKAASAGPASASSNGGSVTGDPNAGKEDTSFEALKARRDKRRGNH